MYTSKSIRPVNSILFISDVNGGEVPEWVRGKMILATPSCLSFQCYPEQDGPTEITLGSLDELDRREVPAFEGKLETPSRQLVISTVDRETVLQMQVKNAQTQVKIWLSHPQWPENVIIGVR
jgi:hypothetical protein